METSSGRAFAARGARIIARVAVALAVFSVVAPAPAASAPQPQVCKSATQAISV